MNDSDGALWRIGPFAIWNTPNYLASYVVLPDGSTVGYEKLWQNIMIRAPKSGSKLGKATRDDIDRVWALLQNGQELIEQSNALDDLKIDELWHLFEAADRGAGRVVFGAEVMIDNCADPNLSYLAFKPEIKQGLWLRKRLRWLIWLMVKLRIRPWDWW